MPGHVFISHSTRDDATVAAIRNALIASGVDVWDDARTLVGGDQLEPAVLHALDESRALIAVLSPWAINSRWVTKEIRRALDLQKQRAPHYRVIPVMVDGIEPAGLDHWFPEEPIGVKLHIGSGGIQNALPALLDALGLSLPVDAQRATSVEALPVADLTLLLRDPSVDRTGGTHRAAAVAELIYTPAEAGAPEVRSERFGLVAPIGPIEADDLRWYLERFVSWPSGVFQERAKVIEAKLPEWGRMLHKAVFGGDCARAAYEEWKRCGNRAVRRLTILVDRDLIAAASDADRQAEADEAASLLLSLPWELLHDRESYLFLGPYPVRVRRGLPNRKPKPAFATAAPLRVLLLSPRPEDERAAYIDHRVSARPVVEALASLGELAELKLLRPPTFAALAKELDDAQRAGTPYHVVHFDGHGVYSQQTGLGALCFERPEDSNKIENRRSDIVDAAKLAEVMRDQRVPLFFLEACETAMAEKDPTASVAGTLLQGGVASVVAMSHSVLVETARRFVTEFYQELLEGQRIGEAMVRGQRDLKAHTFRYRTFQGEVHLEDWFVPVLYQEEADPQLIHEVPAQRVQEVLARQRSLSLGALPEAPAHGFVGRSRELLKAERALESARYVVLRGEGGEGKTTLAAELARWLVATRRFDRVAFVSLEKHGERHAVLFELAHQLVVGSVPDDDRAWLEIERALRERRTLVLFDNAESVLPPQPAFEPEVLQKILDLAEKMESIGETRIVFTTRQPMPEPFGANEVPIGRLARSEAIDLVARALGKAEEAPRPDDAGESEDEVTRLVDAVGCHARSLVLLAREVAESGVRNATERLTELMARLHERYPDDRERSLFASVELSLRRLPEGLRELIRPLAVFQGGGHLGVIAHVLGFDFAKPQLVQGVAAALNHVGLAEALPYGYLRLDPALGPLLSFEMSEAERDEARKRWAEAMVEFSDFLYQQRSGENPQIASTLTSFDLANLLSALDHVFMAASAEQTVDLATTIEGLLQPLARPKVLQRAARVRELATKKLGDWSHARFIAEDAAVQRFIDVGRYGDAVTAARALLDRALAGGENAYAEAAYDVAMAHALCGRALKRSGDAAAALELVRVARDRFLALAAAGNRTAARMASVSITEAGDCLVDLGRLEEAVAAYDDAVRRSTELSDGRTVAVNKAQIGTVRLLQRRYAGAIAAYDEARQTFEELGEPKSVAAMHHQMGTVHRRAGNYEEAETALQASLRLEVASGNRLGEASTLGALGTLYSAMNRPEDAARFFQEAAALREHENDLAGEGRVRHNMAQALIQLGRYDDARRQILRAIECDEPFGHTAQPWKTFDTLADLEEAVDNPQAAKAARENAVRAYLAYRRDGGENLSGGAEIFAFVAQAIADQQTGAAEAELAQLMSQPDVAQYLTRHSRNQR